MARLAAAVALLLLSSCAAAPPPGAHHILFLASDDMRPEMSPYGHDYMATPSFQRLADDGFTFRRSYVQQALCAPSRTVLLTGRRPDTSRVWTIGPYFRDTTGRNWTTLPQFFKEHSWRSIGHGKIFHEGAPSGGAKVNPSAGDYGPDQDQAYGSWSVPYFHPNMTYTDGHRSNGAVDEPWQKFNDGQSTLTAIEWIKNASEYEEPFFLAVGFHRPHIPYIYPKEFEFNGTVVFPPKDYAITKGIPYMAPHDWTTEGVTYSDLKAITPSITAHNFRKNLSSLCTAVPFAKQAEMKRSYYSCIQYVDHLVGQLLQALDEENLYEQTTVIFWGDHGYKLGEHCDWFKQDNYEDSTRFPLIVKPAGGLAHSLAARGQMIEQLVEEVDIFPSLIDLVGIPVPQSLQGTSWVPLLKNPETAGKDYVLMQYPHCEGNDTPNCWKANGTQTMGYSIRVTDWRYTEWLEFDCDRHNPMSNCASAAPQWDRQIGAELYDHSTDTSETFGDFENENLAYLPEHEATVEELHQRLRSVWVPA